eukprot:TRINITY_DN5065_c0_g1_i11.p4 TRINITY_DN5065_c0_g1~~TRINITY_DN5065_c0_g1_i11.p4  ORF type:complete len:117 (-),score=6.38 TRINITY_DN5065_c0_g1_i11:153-503(-)
MQFSKQMNNIEDGFRPQPSTWLLQRQLLFEVHLLQEDPVSAPKYTTQHWLLPVHQRLCSFAMTAVQYKRNIGNTLKDNCERPWGSREPRSDYTFVGNLQQFDDQFVFEKFSCCEAG